MVITMSNGYIYILTNPSLNGLVKIGSTAYNVAVRVKQLSSTTSIPEPFAVAYEIYVNNFQEFEKELHNKLSKYRVNPKREFFKISVESVIEVVKNMAKTSHYKPEDYFEAIEILPKLLKRYGNNINPSIVSVRIYQEIDRVYLETTEYEYIADYLKDQNIHRSDLGFISEWVDRYHDAHVFEVTDPIEKNVEKFMELDDISMVNCAGQLFVSSWDPYKKK